MDKPSLPEEAPATVLDGRDRRDRPTRYGYAHAAGCRPSSVLAALDATGGGSGTIWGVNDFEPATRPEPGPAIPTEPGLDPAPGLDPGLAPGAVQTPAVAGRATPGDTIRRQNRAAAFGLIALFVALAFGGGIAVGRATAPNAGAPSLAPVSVSPGPTAVAGLPSAGPRLGRADAKVVIDYWADYQCPFCAKFAQQVIPQLTSRIADGTVALVHRDYAFLGDESIDAAIAVRCAGREDRYWAMHDAIYGAQQGENKGAFSRIRLGQVAAAVGLDATAFATCMDDRAMLVDVLDDTAAGVRAGIASTPTIDVNGSRFLGVPDVAKLLAAVDAAAAGASPAPLPSRSPSPDPWSGTVTNGREAGGAAAPVTVELWMDYQAKGSGMIVNDLEPELRTRIASGRIRVVQRDLATLGDESVLAATAVRCVARQDGPAWFAHDVLAVSGRGAGSGLYTPDSILRFGSRLGLDVKAFGACLDDPVVAADVRAETATGKAAGLTAGPAVVIVSGGAVVARFTGTLDAAKILAAVDGAG